MQLSPAGYELLQRSEGFSAQVYLDCAGYPTVGYGHRLLHPDSFPSGITERQGAEILASDVKDAEASVARLVKVALTQGQFDALVDFVFNLGATRLAGSTLLSELNLGHYDAAAEQILLWDHAGSREIPALKSRRRSEYFLFKGEAKAASGDLSGA